MSVPKKRRTSASAGKRRSHDGLKKTTLVKCSKCGQQSLPHKACGFCGTYAGREVLKIKAKKTEKK